MTDLEISKSLALAIGWTENRLDENRCLDPDVAVFGGYGFKDEIKVWFHEKWCTFDYRDPAVIWPIAERYDCFPVKPYGELGYPKWLSVVDGSAGYADTAAKAVALAVIGSHAPK